MSGDKVRFGIGRPDGLPGSSYWTLRTSASEQDVYVAGTSPRFMHVSLHRDGNWHAKTFQGVQARHVPYRRPSPIEPGITRALQLTAHGSYGSLGAPIEDREVIWTPPPGNVRMCFDIFLEDQPTDGRWPGRTSMGTTLIARRPLPFGGAVSVVGASALATEETFTVPHNLTAPDAEVIKERIRTAGDPRIVIFGDTADGAIALVFAQVQLAEDMPT